MSDSETLTATKSSNENVIPKYNNDDFGSMLRDLLNKINCKISIFLFLFGILIFSDLFIEMVLIKVNGAVEAGDATTKGTIIQLLALTISYIFLDLFVQCGLL